MIKNKKKNDQKNVTNVRNQMKAVHTEIVSPAPFNL